MTDSELKEFVGWCSFHLLVSYFNLYLSDELFCPDNFSCLNCEFPKPVFLKYEFYVYSFLKLSFCVVW
jgi:hypothetical protein